MSETMLITGGSGLLAVNWALSMRNERNVVLGLHERLISIANVTTQVISLESSDQVKTILEKIQPRVVIHTVAFTDVDACEAQPELARHVNIDLAVHVAEACSDFGIQFVHISTDHLFAGNIPFLDETQTVQPINIYGKTKAEAEHKVLERYPEALVVRANFYGWGPVYRRSFSDFIIEALRNGRRIELFDDVFYTPILIEDLVLATHQILKNKKHGIFNLVGDDRLSKYDFGIKLAGYFGLDTGLITRGRLCDKPQKVNRPFDMSLSNDKACKTLGRRLGGVDEHMQKLLKQEQYGVKKELEDILKNK